MPPDGRRTVQLLVHGFTLSQEYFDPPYESERYSYVRRAGRVDGVPADRVVLVGHSYGTALALMAASRVGGVDAVVAVGFLHLPQPAGPVDPGPELPRSARPGVRDGRRPARLRHHGAGLPLALLRRRQRRSRRRGPRREDQADRQSSPKWPPSASSSSPAPSPASASPSSWFPERPHLTASPCIEGFIQPRAGHNISLERNNTEGWAAELAFLDRHGGPTGLTAGAACPPGAG